MNTHADKPQESKSLSFADNTSQKHTGSEATFQFVDNRPEAARQRKLKEIANNSPQLNQRAFQDMGISGKAPQKPWDNTTTFQLKINSESLNVVGEAHTESESRRPIERDFSNNTFGPDKYWQENEFKVKDPTTFDTSYADPVKLRIASRIMILIFDTNSFCSKLDELSKKSDKKEVFASLETSALGLISTAKQVCIEGAREPEACKGFDFSNAQLGEFFEFFLAFIKDLQLVKDNVKNHFLRSEGKRKEDFATALESVQRWLGQLNKIESDDITSNPGEIQDKIDTHTLYRSLDMHESAKTMKNNPGIWKVGERHVQEIEEVVNEKKSKGKSEDIPYNLEHEDEFDKEIEEYIANRM